MNRNITLLFFLLPSSFASVAMQDQKPQGPNATEDSLRKMIGTLQEELKQKDELLEKLQKQVMGLLGLHTLEELFQAIDQKEIRKRKITLPAAEIMAIRLRNYESLLGPNIMQQLTSQTVTPMKLAMIVEQEIWQRNKNRVTMVPEIVGCFLEEYPEAFAELKRLGLEDGMLHLNYTTDGDSL